MFKSVARRPIRMTKTYLKFGFVITEHEFFYCPRCGKTLNAGPAYQPNYCSGCGQHVTFKGIRWKEDVEIGYKREDGRGGYAPI